MASSFSIRGENGNHLSIALGEVLGFPEHTSHLGGYDVRCSIIIKSGSYRASGDLWSTTGEIHRLAVALESSLVALTGSLKWTIHEGNFSLELRFGERGNVQVHGAYQEYMHEDSRLVFEFQSDQSFLAGTLEELNAIVTVYGNDRGTVSTKASST